MLLGTLKYRFHIGHHLVHNKHKKCYICAKSYITCYKLGMVFPSSSQSRGLCVLETLAASGLRYALDVPGVGSVVANDFSMEAYWNICRNNEGSHPHARRHGTVGRVEDRHQ